MDRLFAFVRAHPVHSSTAFFTACATIEIFLSFFGIDSQHIFPALFLVDMALRLKQASLPAAQIRWPTPPLLWLYAAISEWCSVAPVFLCAESKLFGQLQAKLLRALLSSNWRLLRNPLRTIRLVRQVLRVLRWITWLVPLWPMVMGIKDATRRYLRLRAQQLALKRTKATAQLFLKRQPQREVAASFIQSMYRGKVARRELSKLKQLAQLRARWAAAVIVRAAGRSRERRLRAAEACPLLIRPDSPFSSSWSFAMLAIALFEALLVLLAKIDFDGEGRAEFRVDDLVALAGASCKVESGFKLFWFAGPRVFEKPLPEHCSANAEYSLQYVQEQALTFWAHAVQIAIMTIATLDVFVNFFTGTLDPTTGNLEPKTFKERYILPPYSLGFCILVNPVMACVNELLRPFIDIEQPLRLFRLVVWLQPLASRAERTFAFYVRLLVRRHKFFASQRAQTAKVGMLLATVTMQQQAATHAQRVPPRRQGS